jgi:RNA polymerase sigma factor (sigma-70 family)
LPRIWRRETFVRAFAGRARFDSRREDALPFLYGIAANLIRRHRRSESRMLRAYARTVVAEIAPGASEASEVPALAEALRELRSEEREVLLLFAWADLDYEQIAEALAIPVGTVRSRLSRARSRVRERLRGTQGPTREEAAPWTS